MLQKLVYLIKKIIHHIRWRLRLYLQIYFPQFWWSLQLASKVHSGPFVGMQYVRNAIGSVVLPKIIGTYENELHAVLQEINFSQYAQVIDVGAAEGYYAVGLLYTGKASSMIAFEAQALGRKRLKRLARLNAVEDKLQVLGTCQRSDLQKLLQPGKRTLLIMDVEGYEQVLLTPPLDDFLVADILVEMHPEVCPGFEQILKQNFENTHVMQRIKRANTKKLPTEIQWPRAIQLKEKFVLNEFRGPQFWYWLSAKTSHYTSRSEDLCK
jgi:hypothetical protein